MHCPGFVYNSYVLLGSDEEDEDPFFDDYQEQLAELNAEEPPEEEQEEEETEEDFEERTRSSLIEAFEEQNNSLSTIQVALHTCTCVFVIEVFSSICNCN